MDKKDTGNIVNDCINTDHRDLYEITNSCVDDQQIISSTIDSTITRTSTTTPNTTTSENIYCFPIEYKRLKENDTEDGLMNTLINHTNNEINIKTIVELSTAESSSSSSSSPSSLDENNLNKNKIKLSLSQEQFVLHRNEIRNDGVLPIKNIQSIDLSSCINLLQQQNQQNQQNQQDGVKKSRSASFSQKFSIFKHRPIYNISIDDDFIHNRNSFIDQSVNNQSVNNQSVNTQSVNTQSFINNHQEHENIILTKLSTATILTTSISTSIINTTVNNSKSKSNSHTNPNGKNYLDVMLSAKKLTIQNDEEKRTEERMPKVQISIPSSSSPQPPEYSNFNKDQSNNNQLNRSLPMRFKNLPTCKDTNKMNNKLDQNTKAPSPSPALPSEINGLPNDLRSTAPRSMNFALNDEFVDETCKCTICKYPFQEPIVLDCLHTFCLNCLMVVTTEANNNNNSKYSSSNELPTHQQILQQHQQQIDRHHQKFRDNSDLELSCTETKISDSTFPNSNSEMSMPDLKDSKQRLRRSTASENQSLLIPRRRSASHHHKSAHKSRGGGGGGDRSNSMRSTATTTTTGGAAGAGSSTSTSKIHERPTKSKIINCTICGWTTEIPIGGISQLPRNFLLIRKIENTFHQINRNLLNTTWCSLCSEEVLAIACCLNCAINLCNFCKEAHYRQKTTATHNIQYLNELKLNYAEQQLNGMEQQKGKNLHKCQMHPNYELKLFCINCLQVICNNCTILLHRGHKCEPILKAYKVYLKSIRDELDRTKPLIDFTSESIIRLNGFTKKINQRAECVENEVEYFLTKYYEALAIHQTTLLKQIRRAKETKIQIIIDQQCELEKRLCEAKRIIKFTDDLLTNVAGITTVGSTTATAATTTISNCNPIELLSFVNVLQQRFAFVCQKPKQTIDYSKVSDSLQFIPTIQAPATMNQQSTHNIPIYGIIATQTANPMLCQLMNVENLMFLRIHRKCELIMMAKDNDNRQLCHGGLTIRGELKYKDNLRMIDVQVADKRDGTYIISFIPDAVGLLSLNIFINDKQQIKGSPFTLCARQLSPHSGIFHCCTFCSSNGSKTAVCACKSIMAGGYKGCGHGHDGHPGKRHWSCCANTIEPSECTSTNEFR